MTPASRLPFAARVLAIALPDIPPFLPCRHYSRWDGSASPKTAMSSPLSPTVCRSWRESVTRTTQPPIHRCRRTPTPDAWGRRDGPRHRTLREPVQRKVQAGNGISACRIHRRLPSPKLFSPSPPCNPNMATDAPNSERISDSSIHPTCSADSSPAAISAMSRFTASSNFAALDFRVTTNGNPVDVVNRSAFTVVICSPWPCCASGRASGSLICPSHRPSTMP